MEVSVKSNRRPSATNTLHFVCFDCRKAFKQPGSSGCDPEIPKRPFDCPNCKQPMTSLGRYFKAPPQRAIRQWLKVELLYAYGVHFSAHNTSLDKKCDTLTTTIRYLIESGHEESEVRWRLEQIRKLRQHYAARA
jgi:hypothetical protein